MYPAPVNGKTVLVTGANTGIGYFTARDLARQGATVVLGCRDKTKGEAACARIRREVPGATIELLLLDLAAPTSIRAAAAEFKRRHARLDVLLNNAGLMLQQRQTSAEGLELTFASNHLGHFLLTRLLLDRLKASAPSRIINVASDAHRGGAMHWDDLQSARSYSGWVAYSQSKLANVLFTYELARRLEGTGVTANCLHPGVIASEFFRDLPWIIKAPASWVLTTPEKGARPQVRLANDPALEGVTGRYFDKFQESRSSDESYDPAAARRLWELSERLAGAD